MPRRSGVGEAPVVPGQDEGDGVTVFHGDAAQLPGTATRLPLRFPTGRPRIALLVLRTLIFAGMLAALAVIPGHRIERYGVVLVDSGFPGWLWALLFWILVCAMVILDGNRVCADRDGIRIRSRLFTRWVPWHALQFVVSTGTGLGLSLVDGTTERYELVDRSWRTRMAVRTSPMVALAAELESLRRALATSGWTNHSAQPWRRLLVLSGAEWLQILGMGVLLAAIAALSA